MQDGSVSVHYASISRIQIFHACEGSHVGGDLGSNEEVRG